MLHSGAAILLQLGLELWIVFAGCRRTSSETGTSDGEGVAAVGDETADTAEDAGSSTSDASGEADVGRPAGPLDDDADDGRTSRGWQRLCSEETCPFGGVVQLAVGPDDRLFVLGRLEVLAFSLGGETERWQLVRRRGGPPEPAGSVGRIEVRSLSGRYRVGFCGDRPVLVGDSEIHSVEGQPVPCLEPPAWADVFGGKHVDSIAWAAENLFLVGHFCDDLPSAVTGTCVAVLGTSGSVRLDLDGSDGYAVGGGEPSSVACSRGGKCYAVAARLGEWRVGDDLPQLLGAVVMEFTDPGWRSIGTLSARTARGSVTEPMMIAAVADNELWAIGDCALWMRDGEGPWRVAMTEASACVPGGPWWMCGELGTRTTCRPSIQRAVRCGSRTVARFEQWGEGRPTPVGLLEVDDDKVVPTRASSFPVGFVVDIAEWNGGVVLAAPDGVFWRSCAEDIATL
jgi:hypothetical protein